MDVPNQSEAKVASNNLPENFFDADKKSKKEQQDEIIKAMEEWEKEVATCDAEAKQQIEQELEMQQNDKNIDELDQQLEQWKRFAELEQRAEELQAKVLVKKSAALNLETPMDAEVVAKDRENVIGGDLEDELFDWRSRGL